MVSFLKGQVCMETLSLNKKNKVMLKKRCARLGSS